MGFGSKMTIAVLVGACFTGLVRAQQDPSGTNPPATAPADASDQPTSAPARVVTPADPNGPRGAVKALLQAMQSGDANAISAVIYAANPTEEKVVAALAKRARSEKEFRDAAIKAFGADSARTLVGDAEGANQASMSQIDQSEEKIEGDVAQVSNEFTDAPVTLKRVDGKWRIPASEFVRAAKESELERHVEDMEFAAGLIDSYAKEVAAGKYATAQEAADAIKSHMMEAMMKHAMSRQATSGPATEPSADPSTQPR